MYTSELENTVEKVKEIKINGKSVHESEDLIVLRWQHCQHLCLTNMSNQYLLSASHAFFKNVTLLERLQSVMDKPLNSDLP